METIAAMLILMISFSAGMVIYNNILGAGVNDLAMHSGLEAEFIADSLIRSGNMEAQQLSRSGLVYEVKYTADQRNPGLVIMSVVCRDEHKKQLAENVRLIESDGKGQD
ncbi:hypothetical protein [Pedobacter ginsengisoli]|uniref:hypothetical protein n=1 Tax=Pedobacter ginsengisoli TaxID=363852 RepID=UPI00254AF3F1|nr:hypothetical protein [Pedobacter ginsengisoli]